MSIDWLESMNLLAGLRIAPAQSHAESGRAGASIRAEVRIQGHPEAGLVGSEHGQGPADVLVDARSLLPGRGLIGSVPLDTVEELRCFEDRWVKGAQEVLSCGQARDQCETIGVLSALIEKVIYSRRRLVAHVADVEVDVARRSPGEEARSLPGDAADARGLEQRGLNGQAGQRPGYSGEQQQPCPQGCQGRSPSLPRPGGRHRDADQGQWEQRQQVTELDGGATWAYQEEDQQVDCRRTHEQGEW